MALLPVEQDDGCILLRFDRAAEDHLAQLDPFVPLTAALVVLWDAGECLLVFNRFRQAWELPGGVIDPGESARDAALRELAEESGQQPDALHFAGVAQAWYAPAKRLEHLAIYLGTVAARSSFVANDEMTQSKWWDPCEQLSDLNAIDGALVALVPSNRAQ